MRPYDYLILTIGPLIKALALIGAFHRRPARELLCVKGYLLFSIAADLSQFAILRLYGIRSTVYFRTYYYADLAVVVVGYFVLVRLLELAFEQTRFNFPQLRSAALMLFSGLATISAFVVLMGMNRSNQALLVFTGQLEQNLTFLGMILAILLWIGMNVMLVPGLRFRRVVLAFSILYSSGAILYTVEALFGPSALSRALLELTTPVAAGLFAYTLWTNESEPGTRFPQVSPAEGS
jgi:hypothetical protein